MVQDKIETLCNQKDRAVSVGPHTKLILVKATPLRADLRMTASWHPPADAQRKRQAGSGSAAGS